MSVSEQQQGLHIRLPGIVMHTIAAYFCAVFVCPRLVAMWFGWLLPLIRWHTVTGAADWYISHLLGVTIVPVVVVGYLIARTRLSGSAWAWIAPSVVLVYSMLNLNVEASVLAPPMSRLHYFFGTIPSMPNYVGLNDPVRVLKQMTVTAPFYAGVGYSAGAAIRLFVEGRRGNKQQLRGDISTDVANKS